MGNNIDSKIRKAIDNVVLTVGTRMHDANLTARVKSVILWVEMAVRWISNSSGSGPDSAVQNPDWKDFAGKTEKTPLMSTSRQLFLNIDQDRIDEIHDIVSLEDGDFVALKPNYSRRVLAHYTSQEETEVERRH